MATLTTTTIDGSITEKKFGSTGNITNQSALNGEVIFSMVNHGLVANQPIVFTASTGTNLGGNALLPANITAGTTYYVKAGWSGGSSYFILTGVANNFQVSATPGGANIAWGSGFQGVVSSPGHAFSALNILSTSVTSLLPQLGVAGTTYYYGGDEGSNLVNTVYNVASGNIVVAYRNEAMSSFGFAVVGTLNDLVLDSCSYTSSGTGLTITGGNSALYVDAIRAGFTVEGTGIPAGTTIASTGPFVLSAAATQTVSNGTLTIKNSTVGGVTWGNPVQFMTYNPLGGTASPTNTSGIAIADLPGSSKVVIAWSQGPDDISNVNNGGFAKVATISGLTISYGAVSTFEASGYGLQTTGSRSIFKSMVSDTTNNRVILVWCGHGATYSGSVNRQGRASVGTVSGTTLTWNTQSIFEPDDNASNGSGSIVYQSVAWDAALQKFVIVWEDQDGASNTLGNAAVVGTVDGSHNITFGTVSRNPVYNGDGDQNAIAYNASSGKMVYAYRRYDDNVAFGFVRVGTVSGTGVSGTVTWGAESSFPLVNDTGNGVSTGNRIYDMRIIDHADAQKVLITYTIAPGSISGHIRGVAGTVTGTTISLSSEVTLNTDNGNPGSTTTDTGLAYDTVHKKIIVVTNSNQVGSPHAIQGKGTEVHFDGNNITIDLAASNFFEVDLENLTENISAITTSNPSATHVSSFVLKLTQGSTARQIEFSELSAFKWIGGTAPTLTTTDNAVDILSFTTYDNGTTWHGTVVGQNYS